VHKIRIFNQSRDQINESIETISSSLQYLITVKQLKLLYPYWDITIILCTTYTVACFSTIYRDNFNHISTLKN